MPTVRGWLVLAMGLALGGVGHVFGSGAIDQLGFALFALVVIACGVVRLGRHELHVRRVLAPERVRASQPVTVTLEIHNRGIGAAPLVLLEDSVPAELAAKPRFALHGIEAGGHRRLSYEVTPPRRGRFSVGPLEMSFVDPFGLAAVRRRDDDGATFLSYPAVEKLALPRDFGERRTAALSSLRQLTGASGEDFYTLREYVEGDDLRKINWAATAKRARVMIRQEETPWQTSGVVLIDDRGSAHQDAPDASSFERSVEAAASLCDLFHRSGYSFSLLTARDIKLVSGRGPDHLHRALDFLATIDLKARRADDDSLLARLAELQAGSRAEASLVVVSGALDAEAAVLLSNCRRRFRQVTVVVFPAHRFGGASTKDRWEGEKNVVQVGHLLARGGVRSVVVGPDEPLSLGWSSTTLGGRNTEGTWGPRPELV